MNANTLVQTTTLQLPHSRRDTIRVTPPHSRFSADARRLPDNLVDRLAQAGSEYDREVAYALAVMSGWCYSDGKTLARKIPYYGLPEGTIDEILVSNPAMFIVASAFFYRSDCGRVGILAFRGTEPDNTISWLTDADVVQRSLGKGLVHQGFYANLRAVWDEIDESFSSALLPAANGGHRSGSPLRSLYLTGHSLGGAMAVLAAAKLILDDHQIARALKGIYTFGQPAVGNRDFVDHFEPVFGDRLFRHDFAHDLVPKLPPAWNGRYVHFGTLRATPSADEAWAIQSVARRQITAATLAFLAAGASFVTRRLPLLEGLVLPYSLDDHSPTRYIEASRAALMPS